MVTTAGLADRGGKHMVGDRGALQNAGPRLDRPNQPPERAEGIRGRKGTASGMAARPGNLRRPSVQTEGHLERQVRREDPRNPARYKEGIQIFFLTGRHRRTLHGRKRRGLGYNRNTEGTGSGGQRTTQRGGTATSSNGRRREQNGGTGTSKGGGQDAATYRRKQPPAGRAQKSASNNRQTRRGRKNTGRSRKITGRSHPNDGDDNSRFGSQTKRTHTARVDIHRDSRTGG